MKKFIISEEEKNRILGMHVEATKRHYGLVSEQREDGVYFVDINGNQYRWKAITNQESLDNFLNSAESVDKIGVLAGGIHKIFGFDNQSGGGFDIDKTKREQVGELVNNVQEGLRKIAQNGRKLTKEDMKDVRTNLTQSKYTPGKTHSEELYMNIINNIADVIIKQNQLPPLS